jgi:predicted transcriptional regulator
MGKMAKYYDKKPTVAVTLDRDVVAELKEIAKAENRSVSQIVELALVHYFPLVRSGMNDSKHYSLEMMVSRLVSAVTTSDMRQCGVIPSYIKLNEHGQVTIGLQQMKDADGNAIPIEDDLSIPFEMAGEVIKKEIVERQRKQAP